MTVFILREEWNLPTAEQLASDPVMGVFSVEGDANTARTDAVKEAQAEGKLVYGEPNGTDDWDVDYHVDPHEVQGAATTPAPDVDAPATPAV